MPRFTLIHADIFDALREIPDTTFDAVICDAPYGLSITKSRAEANWDSSSVAFATARGRRLAPHSQAAALLEWPAALVVKPGATVLDAFAGSGAVSEAVIRAGAGAVMAVEQEADYNALVRARIEGMG